GQTERAELSRLCTQLRCLPGDEQDSQRKQQRVQELLASGVRPCLPELVNSIGMRFVLIPAGKFMMGSPESEEGRSPDEGPQHEVEISQPFYLGIHPVTQRQWQTVMGDNPSYFCASGDGEDKVKGLDTSDFPVEQVSWEDAAIFLEKLA